MLVRRVVQAPCVKVPGPGMRVLCHRAFQHNSGAVGGRMSVLSSGLQRGLCFTSGQCCLVEPALLTESWDYHLSVDFSQVT